MFFLARFPPLALGCVRACLRFGSSARDATDFFFGAFGNSFSSLGAAVNDSSFCDIFALPVAVTDAFVS